MPSSSISLSGFSLSPAVSVNSTTTPPKFNSTPIESLVVPATFEVMARSLFAKALRRVDFPALGGPTIATPKPSLISAPLSAEAKASFTKPNCSLILKPARAKPSSSISSSGKSREAST